jgi:hypothetical protein
MRSLLGTPSYLVLICVVSFLTGCDREKYPLQDVVAVTDHVPKSDSSVPSNGQPNSAAPPLTIPLVIPSFPSVTVSAATPFQIAGGSWRWDFQSGSYADYSFYTNGTVTRTHVTPNGTTVHDGTYTMDSHHIVLDIPFTNGYVDHENWPYDIVDENHLLVTPCRDPQIASYAAQNGISCSTTFPPSTIYRH